MLSAAAAAALSPASVSPPWTELPSDLTANILQRLGTAEILHSAQFVCATWWKVCLNPDLWRVIEFENLDRFSINKFVIRFDGNSDHMNWKEGMCRRAVDLSQGQLIDLTLSYFCNDNLLDYIVDQSSHLQRLTLAFCLKMTSTTLIEGLKKLHELEELHLIFTIHDHNDGDVEAIGNACPMLKSFTFNNRIGWWIPHGNKQALAIAKTMPNLYHLGLYASDMSNEGLQAILDGCPHLESLDLRKCSRVDLDGQLGERCRKQIKHMKLPSDSIDDYEYSNMDSDFEDFDDYEIYC